MNIHPTKSYSMLITLLTVGLTLVTACGGAGGPGGGISGTGIVFGPITDVGSHIVVSNISFDASKSAVVINGAAAGTADLRLGMLVTVQGLIDANSATGVAEAIDFNATLKGPVEAVDTIARTIQVLSQLVLTDTVTTFDGVTLATLMQGNIVEVSGFIDSDGLVHATRVELEDNADEFRVEGTIADLDTTAETFSIGLLIVDFSGGEIKDAPPGGLANGLAVQVEGSTAPSGGIFVADQVKVREADSGGMEGDELEVEGFVTAVASANEFTLNARVTVLITASTKFEGGTASDIAVNVRLEADGARNQSGALVAEKIEFEGSNGD